MRSLASTRAWPLQRPYVGELALGAVVRSLRNQAYFAPSELLSRVFGTRPRVVRYEWFANLSPLGSAMAPPMSALQLAQDHTLLPYATALAPASVAREVRVRLGKTGLVVSPTKLTVDVEPVSYLRVCAHCVASDQKTFAEPIWRRLHQFSSLSRCPQHDTPLYASDVPGRCTPEQLRTPWPTRFVFARSRRVVPVVDRATEGVLAQRCSALLSKPIGTSAHLGSSSYRRWLRSMGLRSGKDIASSAVDARMRSVLGDVSPWWRAAYQELGRPLTPLQHLLIRTILTAPDAK